MQLTKINTAAKGQIGLCLSFADDYFGIPHAEPTATVAWNKTVNKHLDRNFPTDTIVPIWFTFKNKAGGDLGSHIAAHRPDGVIVSSPWESGTTHAELNSIEQLIGIYSDNGKNPMTYLGWSEDIAGVRIIQPQGDDMVQDNQHLNALTMAYFNRGPSQDEIDRYVGKASYSRVLEDFDSSEEYAAVKASYADALNWKNHAVNEFVPQIKELQTKLTENDAAQKILSDMQDTINKYK